MNRPEEITEQIRKLAEISKEVSLYLTADNMSARMLSMDINNMIARKDQLLKENEQIKEQSALLIAEGERVKQSIINDAESIRAASKVDRVAAAQDRNAAKLELQKAKEMRYLAEKEADKILKRDKVAA